MKVVIGMATTEERYEYAVKAIESLKGQCDSIHLHVNSLTNDKADNGKFVPLKLMHKQGEYADYFFSVDDDLIYPKNYVRDMIKAIDEHKCIVTYHGRKLVGTGKDYYKDHVAFSCLRDMDGTVRVDVAGTGCTAFSLKYFNPWLLSDEQDLRMADLVFSLQAAKEGKKIMCLKHSKNLFKYLDIPKELTIFERESKNPTRQNELADEIYRLNYESK